ncbi:MAG: phosphatase PAP2-related protein [Candidatus Kapaibacteriales bacterium]
MLSVLAHFICWVETRQGLTFNDPLLSLFSPVDLTWIIFSVLYISVFWSIFSLAKTPIRLTQTLLAYSLILLLRMIAMYLLPLDAPKTIIPLKDPLIESFTTDITLTKDLFFSGHTALIFLLFLSGNTKWEKFFLFIGTIIVAGGVLLQHVHYSIDVLIAFFITYSCWKISTEFERKFLGNK